MIGQEHQLQQLIANVALLHNELQKQSQQALNLQHDGIVQLQQQLVEIDERISAALSNQLADLSNVLSEEIANGGRQGMSEFSTQLEDLKSHMSQFASFAAITEKRLNQATKSLVMRIAYLFGFVFIAVLGMSIWLGMHYSKIIQNNKITAESLQLYQKADLVKCGNDLCARVQNNTPTEYKKQGYVLIKQK